MIIVLPRRRFPRPRPRRRRGGRRRRRRAKPCSGRFCLLIRRRCVRVQDAEPSLILSHDRT